MKYRKKPVVIEAIQLNWRNWNDMCDFIGNIISEDNPARRVKTYSDTCGEPGPEYLELTIPTLEGDHIAKHGDYIIKGIKEELYPCKPDIFEQTYEPVKEKRYVYYVSFHSGALSGGVVTGLNKKLDDEETILQLAKSLEKELKVTPIIINNFILLKEEFINE